MEEYKDVRIPAQAEASEFLNQYAKDGWELVQLVQTSGVRKPNILILKREKKEKPKK